MFQMSDACIAEYCQLKNLYPKIWSFDCIKAEKLDIPCPSSCAVHIVWWVLHERRRRLALRVHHSREIAGALPRRWNPANMRRLEKLNKPMMIGLSFESWLYYHSTVSASKEQNWWSKFNTRFYQCESFLKEASERSQPSPWTDHDDRYLRVRRKLEVGLPNKYWRRGTVFIHLIRHSTLWLQQKEEKHPDLMLEFACFNKKWYKQQKD